MMHVDCSGMKTGGSNIFHNFAIGAVAVFLMAGSVLGNESVLTPDEILVKLEQGNKRFVVGDSIHPNTSSARIVETAEFGQEPFATVIACSDSRVPVERLFDAGIGDLFVIRVAGNVCDVDEVGSIEYGVDHLETPVMVVMGHTGCGAVTAVATGAVLHGSIPALVDNIAPAVAKARAANPGLDGEAIVPAAVIQNVWQSIEDLLKSSPATRARFEAGTLKVVGAVYDIGTGNVEWLAENKSERILERVVTSLSKGHNSGGNTPMDHEVDRHGTDGD